MLSHQAVELGQESNHIHGHDYVADPAHTTTRVSSRTAAGSSTATGPVYERLDPDVLKDTQPQTRIVLRPIAAPSCVGFCMFFHSTFIVATYLASWWGRSDSQSIVWPFVAVTGLGQFIAGFYGFSARDNLACVIHVTWGAFFIAYGIQQYLIDIAVLTAVDKFAPNSELAIWFVTLAAVTWCCFFATIGRDFIIGCTTFFLALGATLLFAGWFASDDANLRRTIKAGAYVLILSALCALYRMLRYLIEEGFVSEHPAWWPVYKSRWETRRGPIKIPLNEPGVKKGQ